MAQPAEHVRNAAVHRFDWSDPLLLETALTEEERMVRDTARDYAQGALMPRILEANRTEHFDPAIMREMGSADCSEPPSTGTAAPASDTSATA